MPTIFLAIGLVNLIWAARVVFLRTWNSPLVRSWETGRGGRVCASLHCAAILPESEGGPPGIGYEALEQNDTACEHEEKMLVEELGGHNAREEYALYPELDRLLTDEEKKEVFEAMAVMPESS
jgi:hypothetical protein